MENNITNKELFYRYAESLGIKINDAQRLMTLALASREEVLPQANVIKSVCDHEYITDANWKSLTCRKCNDRIEPKQTVL